MGSAVIRVFGWQTSTAAEHHFRIGMPFPLLDPTRFDVNFGQPGEDIFDYDVVFAHRLAGPAPLWDKLCANPNVLTIYDMDDDLLCVDPENTAPYRIFAPLAADTKRNVEQADMVTVPNQALAFRYHQFNSRVGVLPICIPDDLPYRPKPASDQFTVGWAGSMHKRQDWEPDAIASRLLLYSKLQPEARFHVMGGDYTKGLLGSRCRHTPFVLDCLDYYRHLDFDIGINPLMRSKFNAVKSHTKLIEYGARAIPTVASAIGENTEWIKHGINGFLVHDPSEWVPLLLALSDPETYPVMAAAAYQSSLAWTIGKHIHLWESAFEGVLP